MTRMRADLPERIRRQPLAVSSAPPVASVWSHEGIPAVQDRACLAVTQSAFDGSWFLTQSRPFMDATGAMRRFASVGDAVMRL